jgi:hypothetical protein
MVLGLIVAFGKLATETTVEPYLLDQDEAAAIVADDSECHSQQNQSKREQLLLTEHVVVPDTIWQIDRTMMRIQRRCVHGNETVGQVP